MKDWIFLIHFHIFLYTIINLTSKLSIRSILTLRTRNSPHEELFYFILAMSIKNEFGYVLQCSAFNETMREAILLSYIYQTNWMETKRPSTYFDPATINPASDKLGDALSFSYRIYQIIRIHVKYTKTHKHPC